MLKYCITSKDVARYAESLVKDLPRGSRLTMTIEREKSGDYYVFDVTNSSSGVTGMDVCSDQPPTT